MKTTYNEIEITYREDGNDWEFELRGRTRTAESLAKAKELIDKEPAEKKKPFPRFKAYKISYNREVSVVNITSGADEGYGGKQFWIVDAKGSRSKEQAKYLYPVNPKNDALLVDRREIEAKMTALSNELEAVTKKMETATMPAGFED